MDYEKKYKEALVWMQSLYDSLHGATKEDAEHYFPELVESEDEKIISTIRKLLEAKVEDLGNGVTRTACLAWIEKQGKQKPDLNEEAMENIVQELKEREDKKWRKWLIGHLEGYINITDAKYAEVCKKAIDWLKKQDEKKPDLNEEAMVTLIPELKENEDERIREKLIAIFKGQIPYSSAEDNKKFVAWLEKQSEPKEKPTKEQVWDYCNKISSEWWQITMDKWNTLADEDKNKYNQFIGFNDFSDTLMNITAGALFQLIDTGKLEYEEGSLLLEKPDDTPKPLEVTNSMNEKQGEQKPANEVKPRFKVGDWITNSIETVQITGYDIDYGYQIEKKSAWSEEEKQLLLKDLCARLPYGVIVEIISYGQENLKPWFGKLSCKDLDCFIYDVSYKSVKPYLRPMSSMTEEEKREFIHCAEYEVEESVNGRHYEYYLKDYVGTSEKPICNCNAIDWLNAHHFDYRDLIEMGLALPAPEGMY